MSKVPGGKRDSGRPAESSAPAGKMRRYAGGELTVRRDKRRSAPRRFHGFTQGDGNGLRFFARCRHLKRLHSAERAVGGLEVAPTAGQTRRKHRVGNVAAADSARVMLTAPAPQGDIVPRRAHAVEQELQGILGMRFMGGRGSAGHRIRGKGSDRLPRRLIHFMIETGKNDAATRQDGYTPEQACDRWRCRRYASGDEEAGWRLLSPARCEAVEQPVAPVGKVDEAKPRQFVGPAPNEDGEKIQRSLPMSRQFVRKRQIGQGRDRHPLHLHLVENGAERLTELYRLRGVHRLAGCLLNHARQDHLAPHRCDGGRDGLSLRQRIERAARLFA